MQRGVLDCVLVVLHAPHTGYSEEARSQWWHQAKQDLVSLGRAAPLILLGDFNAVVSSFDSPAVGPLAGEVADLSGALSAAIANELGLRLVNTFASPDFPDKLRPTWKHKCIDYIGVPEAWERGAQHIAVDVDLGNEHEDHFMVAAAISLPRFPRSQQSKKAYKRPRQKNSRRPPGPLPWTHNVHEHEEALFRSARVSSSCAKEPKVKPFFSPTSLQLLMAKKDLHRQVRAMPTREVADPVTVNPLVEQFRQVSKALKSSLKADKVAYVQSVADRIKNADCKSEGDVVWKALRFFRPAGKNVKKPFRALPVLQNEEGATMLSFQAQQELRAGYFGDMEAAVVMTAAARTEQWPDFHVPSDGFDLFDSPSLLQVEQCLRDLPSHKAPGPSGISNSVWKADVPASAKAWFPVFAKAHKRLTEPFRFSAGTCVSISKGRGPPASLSSFRSVSLLEGIGKGFRKLLRSKLVADVAGKAPELFAGCLPGSLTSTLTHYLVTCLRLAKLQHHTSGILFLDAQSAYYRALRCRLTGEEASDDALCSILHTMGVDPSLSHFGLGARCPFVRLTVWPSAALSSSSFPRTSLSDERLAFSICHT